jgi:hypothetical protein
MGKILAPFLPVQRTQPVARSMAHANNGAIRPAMTSISTSLGRRPSSQVQLNVGPNVSEIAESGAD